jgi:MOSC domain-containing protein YiiM
MDVTGPRDFGRYLEVVRAAPREAGRVERIVRRPAVDRREVVDTAVLDVVRGLVGDSWLARGSKRTPDGSANPDAQITLMSTRVLAAIEPDRERWPLAGDQLLVDFDLGMDALPVNSRLAIGSAVLEVTAQPHTGCAKFSARFGSDALRWINSPEGRELRLRGMYARVSVGGLVRSGDPVRRA